MIAKSAFFGVAVALLAPPLAAAQPSGNTDEEYRAQWEANRARELERHRSFALQCDDVSEGIDEKDLEALKEGAVTDPVAFECEADWVRIESALQSVLPLIGEQGYAGFIDPVGSTGTIAIRDVTIAYGSISAVRSIECHFRDDEASYKDMAIGGTARMANLWRARSDADLAMWRLEISAADCEFLREKMRSYRPQDIIHNRPWGSVERDGVIFLVHGSSFMEFLDENGDYTVVLRPGIHQPADTLSEETEAVLATMADYFAQRAVHEGIKTVLDPTNFEFGSNKGGD